MKPTGREPPASPRARRLGASGRGRRHGATVAAPACLRDACKGSIFRSGLRDMAASRLDVAVVGAGVVGLAIARELSRPRRARRRLRAERDRRRRLRRATRRRAPAVGDARSPAVWRGSRRRSTPTRTSGWTRRCRSASARAGTCSSRTRRRRSRGWPRTSPCRTAKASRRGSSRPARRPSSSPASRPTAVVGAAWCAEDGYFDRPQSRRRGVRPRASTSGSARSPRSSSRLADAVVVAARRGDRRHSCGRSDSSFRSSAEDR